MTVFFVEQKQLVCNAIEIDFTTRLCSKQLGMGIGFCIDRL